MSFQQSLAGLNAASKNLDTVGHNIANASTPGFKRSRLEFAESLAAAGETAAATSVGIGVSTLATTQMFMQGDIKSTGNNLDVAINGNGFFMLEQVDGTMAFSRAGNFQRDREGFIKSMTNDKVLGYSVDPETNQPLTGVAPAPLKFSSSHFLPARATKEVSIQLNLDARAPFDPEEKAALGTYGTSVEVYDSQGISTALNLYFSKSNSNTWEIYNSIESIDDGNGNLTEPEPVGYMIFDENGVMLGVFDEVPNPFPEEPSLEPISMTIPTIKNPNDPPENITFDIDFLGSSQFGTNFAVSKLNQDGYTAGFMSNLNIEKDGTVMVSYSNGMKRPEARIALAGFPNQQELEPIGENKWISTMSAGEMVAGLAETGIFGTLHSGALEESNVDLTSELVDLMTAQRYYQSNAQAIKTQDQVFNTLVNLR